MPEWCDTMELWATFARVAPTRSHCDADSGRCPWKGGGPGADHRSDSRNHWTTCLVADPSAGGPALVRRSEAGTP